MVGVPGRSKGCLPCRKRKIGVSKWHFTINCHTLLMLYKCGLQRPACTQCMQSTRECTGYPDKNVFVFVSPGSKKKRSDVKGCKSGEENTSTASIDSRDSLEITAYKKNPLYPFTENSNANRMIMRNSDCIGLINAFISDCFPLDEQHFAYTSDGKPWTYFLTEIPMKSRVLESASVALAAASLGRMHGKPQLSREGLKFYTRSLNQLQKALWDKNKMLEDETLFSCMALSMFEVIECPSNGKSAVESHCKGMMELVRARGVAAHTSGSGYALFLAMRPAGIMQAIREGTPNFLSEPEWMEGPWAITPKSLMDRVQDCLARYPAIIQKRSQFKFLAPDKRVELAQHLVHECWEIERMLDGVYAKIQSTGPNPSYWPVPSKLKVPTKGGLVFPMAYWFTDLMSAWTMIMFWATRMMLWVGLCDLYSLIEGIQPDLVRVSSSTGQPSSASLPQLGHRKDYLPIVHSICQSVEYCLQESMRMAGTVTVSIPLGILVGNLAHRPEYAREIAWIQAVTDIVRRRGLQFIIHTMVVSLDFDSSP
ncbi:hypothetical protein McaMca56_006924 [Microsporum canis]